MNSGIKVFSNNNGRIFLGDALEILSGIPDESVDLVFVDPPYNIGKNFAGRKDKWKTDDEYLAVYRLKSIMGRCTSLFCIV